MRLSPVPLLLIVAVFAGAPCAALGCDSSDGDVDGADFGIFVGQYLSSPTGGPPYATCDFDEDGDVDGADFGVFVHAFQNSRSFSAAVALNTKTDDEPVLPGDFDGDGDVDGADFGVFVGEFQIGDTGGPGEEAPFSRADLNDSGFVDGADFGIFVNPFRAGVPPSYGNAIPEPACAGMLAIVLAAVAARRGRVSRSP